MEYPSIDYLDELKRKHPEIYDSVKKGTFGGKSGSFHSDFGSSFRSQEKSMSAFEESAKRRNELQDEYAKKLKEINDKIKAAVDDEEERNKLIEERNELEKDYIKELEKEPKFISKFNTDIQNIFKNLSNSYGELKSITKEWGKIDQAASKFTKTLGGTKKAMDNLRSATLNNMVKNRIGIDFNISTEELLAAQENYSKAIGRNIRMSNEDQQNIAAMQAMNIDTAGWGEAMDTFGISVEGLSSKMGKMFSEASREGLSFDKIANDVKTNIGIAQNYTFKDGTKGLESMAKKAASIKLDIKAAAALAGKVNTVEGAIDVASKLQVLGGSFANFSDPMGMLNEGLNDMEGLYDRMTKMIGGLGTYNKTTGEVEVSAFNKRRIAAAADAMGVSQEELMKSVNAQARKKEVQSQISASANARGLSKEMQELIANSAQFKDGKAGVSINGQFKSIDELKNGDYKELVKETQSESEDIKDIARNLRSLVDIQEGAEKQKDAAKAQLTSPLARLEKGITAKIGHSNFWLRIIAGAQVMGNFKNIKDSFGNIKNIIKGGPGGNIFKGVGNAFKGVGNAFGKMGKGIGNVFKGVGKGIGKAVGKVAKFIPKSVIAGGGGVIGGSTLALLGGAAAVAAAVAVGRAIAKKRRTAELDGRLSGLGIERQGTYSPEKLKKINNALETGEMSKSVKKTLLRKGDGAIVAQIESVEKAKAEEDRLEKEKRQKEREVKRDKRREHREKMRNGESINGDISKKIHTAYFNIENGNFKNGILGTPQTILKAKAEKGTFEKIKERAISNRYSRGDLEGNALASNFNLTINGTLKLEGKNGDSIDIIDKLKKDPALVSQLTDMIKKKMLEVGGQAYTPGKKANLYQV